MRARGHPIAHVDGKQWRAFIGRPLQQTLQQNGQATGRGI
jgi:hypothetical protein